MRRTYGWVGPVWLSAAIFVAMGCGRKDETILKVDPDSYDKVNPQLKKGERYSAELWQYGKSAPPWSPIDVHIAVVALEGGPKKASDLSLKADARLTQVSGGSETRERQMTMALAFDQKKNSWIGNLEDICRSDSRRPGTKKLPRGEFVLKMRITIEHEKEFVFDDIPIRIETGRENQGGE